MAPITHFLASWIVAAKTTDHPRDCRLVALAGLAPDLDGLGIVADIISNAAHHTDSFNYYQMYHHYLLHGAGGGVLLAGVLAAMARCRWRVFVLVLFVFHLHLLCDLVGSRGPDPGDLWPIYYGGPFSTDPMWLWRGQWRLDGWQNLAISVALLIWSIRISLVRGQSFIGVFSEKFDAVFVATLRKWRETFAAKGRSRAA